MVIRELARAKVNLTLTVRGKRPDGYHDLESLVTFAEVADVIELQPGAPVSVRATGPFAEGIIGANLIEKTLDALAALDADLALGSVTLTKNLPVAAGLGGGSADAAAVLRAVRTANARRAAGIDWHGIASRLGADVPVCLDGRPALMWGIGEEIEPLAGKLPALPAVLVNPRVPLSTADVFRALRAGPAPPRLRPRWHADLADADTLVGAMREHGNDLEPPARAVLPLVGDVLSSLSADAGCRVAALSGSGPTCFGIYADDAAAKQAAARIAREHPQWWVVATRLAGTEGSVSSRG